MFFQYEECSSRTQGCFLPSTFSQCEGFFNTRGALGECGNPAFVSHPSFPPEPFCLRRGVLLPQARIHSCFDAWTPASAGETNKDTASVCLRHSPLASLYGSPHPRGRQETRHSRRTPSFPRRRESNPRPSLFTGC